MRQQRRFVADAAHELRSPLTALSLQASERVALLRLGIERHRVLLDQMLALARAQTVSPGAAAVVSVPELFRRAMEDLMPLAEARAIDIGVAAVADLRLAGDPIELLTLVKNLIDNAIRYSPAGGKADLCTHLD